MERRGREWPRRRIRRTVGNPLPRTDGAAKAAPPPFFSAHLGPEQVRPQASVCGPLAADAEFSPRRVGRHVNSTPNRRILPISLVWPLTLRHGTAGAHLVLDVAACRSRAEVQQADGQERVGRDDLGGFSEWIMAVRTVRCANALHWAGAAPRPAAGLMRLGVPRLGIAAVRLGHGVLFFWRSDTAVRLAGCAPGGAGDCAHNSRILLRNYF